MSSELTQRLTAAAIQSLVAVGALALMVAVWAIVYHFTQRALDKQERSRRNG